MSNYTWIQFEANKISFVLSEKSYFNNHPLKYFLATVLWLQPAKVQKWSSGQRVGEAVSSLLGRKKTTPTSPADRCRVLLPRGAPCKTPVVIWRQLRCSKPMVSNLRFYVMARKFRSWSISVGREHTCWTFRWWTTVDSGANGAPVAAGPYPCKCGMALLNEGVKCHYYWWRPSSIMPLERDIGWNLVVIDGARRFGSESPFL